MIVRDEASMVPGFLAAVAGLWDELIAVDTGSRDRTRSLLRDAGARVIDFSWTDDFAAARNASIAAAAGRWILYLDADERVDPTLIQSIKALLRDPRAGAATVLMQNGWPDGSRTEARLIRLFRGGQGIRFRHRIHEDVADDVEQYLKSSGLELRHLSGAVDHLGYIREVAAGRRKKERDLRLLHAALEDEPDDLYCWFKLMELARFWEDRPLWEQTALAARVAVERARPDRLSRQPWSGELAALIAQGLPVSAAAALAWLDQNAGRVCPSPPWQLRRAFLLEACGRAVDAERVYESCLRPEENHAEPCGAASAHRARLGLCRLAAGSGDLPRAAKLARQAAESGPCDPEALLAAVSFQTVDEAAAFAGDHARRHPQSVAALGMAFLGAGRPLPALDILSTAPSDPACVLGLVVCSLAVGREVDVRIDLEPDAAETVLKKWIRALAGGCRPEYLAMFAERSVTLNAAFPSLARWLADENRPRAILSAAGVSSSRR